MSKKQPNKGKVFSQETLKLASKFQKALSKKPVVEVNEEFVYPSLKYFVG